MSADIGDLSLIRHVVNTHSGVMVNLVDSIFRCWLRDIGRDEVDAGKCEFSGFRDINCQFFVYCMNFGEAFPYGAP